MPMRVLWWFMIMLLAAVPAWAADKDAEFKEQLRRALRENPGLIMEVLQQNKAEVYDIARQGAKEEQNRRWRKNLARALANPIKIPLDEARPVIGAHNARFTIFDFSNFMCGACALGATNIDHLMKKYPGQVRLQLKHNPSDDLARLLAKYYEAIGRQDEKKAWRFAKMVYKRQEEVARRKMEAVQEMLGELKVDQAQLGKDLADKSLDEFIKKDEAEADRLKFKNTPTFVINGVAITGAAPVKIFEQVMSQWSARHSSGPLKTKGGAK
jgi:protein-disulfide isomerase